MEEKFSAFGQFFYIYTGHPRTMAAASAPRPHLTLHQVKFHKYFQVNCHGQNMQIKTPRHVIKCMYTVKRWLNLPVPGRILSEGSQRRSSRLEGWRCEPIDKPSTWKRCYLKNILCAHNYN